VRLYWSCEKEFNVGALTLNFRDECVDVALQRRGFAIGFVGAKRNDY
jgi:hypothetical protein